MANQLTKQSSENEIKAYFSQVFNLAQSKEQFPVNLDDVWPLVFTRKNDAVRALRNQSLFIEGIDYQPLRRNAQRLDVPLSKSGQRQGNGQFCGEDKIDYLLTVPCLEFFIARKVRPVFEVYRQVFHKVASAQQEAKQPELLTVDTFLDQFGDPIVDARSYHYVLSEWKRDKFCDWMARRIQSLGLKEGSDYAEYEVAKDRDNTLDARRRDYAFSLRSFARLVKHDAQHVRNAKAMKYTYSILSTLRECERRHQSGQLDMAAYVASVRNATYKLPSARIIRKNMEQQHEELLAQQPMKPWGEYQPLPEAEMEIVGTKINPNSTPGQHDTLKPLAAYYAHIASRFDRMVQLSDGNAEIRGLYGDFRDAYETMRMDVGNLTYVETVYDIEGMDALRTPYGTAARRKEATA